MPGELRMEKQKFAPVHERECGPSACGSSFPRPSLSFLLVTWGNGEFLSAQQTKYLRVDSISPTCITRGRSACAVAQQP